MARRWSIAEIDARIEELETQLSEVVALPSAGSTGQSSLDLRGLPERLRAEIARWELRRRIASGDYGIRQTRGGC